jgi:hypothetical protein
MRAFEFGVLFVIGFNPTKVQIGDIAIKILHIMVLHPEFRFG